MQMASKNISASRASSGGAYANGAAMPPTSATCALSTHHNAPQAHIDRREFYGRATNPALFSSKSLLLNAIGLTCTLGR